MFWDKPTDTEAQQKAKNMVFLDLPMTNEERRVYFSSSAVKWQAGIATLLLIALLVFFILTR